MTEEVDVPTVSALLPKATELPETPLKSPMVVEVVMALISKMAPDALVLTLPEESKEPEPERARVPAEIVVPPVYVLAAVRVHCPEPCLVKEPPEPPMVPL